MLTNVTMYPAKFKYKLICYSTCFEKAVISATFADGGLDGAAAFWAGAFVEFTIRSAIDTAINLTAFPSH